MARQKGFVTGMVAAAYASSKIKSIMFPIEVQVLGGKAEIWIDGKGYSRMIGPAHYS
jgi:diaminopimelate epimerase